MDLFTQIHRCSIKHDENFVFIAPRPQKLEKHQVLVGNEVMGFSEWLKVLKAQWIAAKK